MSTMPWLSLCLLLGEKMIFTMMMMTMTMTMMTMTTMMEYVNYALALLVFAVR